MGIPLPEDPADTASQLPPLIESSSLLGIPDLINVLKDIAYFKSLPQENIHSGVYYCTPDDLVLVRGTAVVYAKGNSRVEARGNATVYLSENAKCVAFDNAKVFGTGNSVGVLFDKVQGNLKGCAEFWCYDQSQVTAWNGYLHLYDRSHASVSHSTVNAYDDSTIALLAHSIIHASGHVVIRQGPFVDTSDVVCGQDAKLIGSVRLGDGTKRNFGSFSPKPTSGI